MYLVSPTSEGETVHVVSRSQVLKMAREAVEDELKKCKSLEKLIDFADTKHQEAELAYARNNLDMEANFERLYFRTIKELLQEKLELSQLAELLMSHINAAQQSRSPIHSSGVPTAPYKNLRSAPFREVPSVPSRENPSIPSRDVPSVPSEDIPTLPSRPIPSLPSKKLSTRPSKVLPTPASRRNPTTSANNSPALISGATPTDPSGDTPKAPVLNVLNSVAPERRHRRALVQQQAVPELESTETKDSVETFRPRPTLGERALPRFRPQVRDSQSAFCGTALPRFRLQATPSPCDSDIGGAENADGSCPKRAEGFDLEAQKWHHRDAPQLTGLYKDPISTLTDPNLVIPDDETGPPQSTVEQQELVQPGTPQPRAMQRQTGAPGTRLPRPKREEVVKAGTPRVRTHREVVAADQSKQRPAKKDHAPKKETSGGSGEAVDEDLDDWVVMGKDDVGSDWVLVKADG